MKILVGDELGIVKCVNTEKSLVDSKFGDAKKQNEVKSIRTLFENNNDIISVLYEGNLNVLSWASKEVFYSEDLKQKAIVTQEIIKNDLLSINILGDNKGNLKLVSFDDEIKVKAEQNYEDCLPKNLQKLKFYQQNEVLSIYKNAPFSIYDINSNKVSFKAKNLPNDELDLKVEMWDTDILSLSNSVNSIYTSTAYGEIRFYDKKVKSRPILNVQRSDKKINCLVKSSCEYYLIFGDSVGSIKFLDIRKDLTHCKSLKGSTGSVKDMCSINKNTVASCGLDRHLNIFDCKQKSLEKHLYLKTKLTCLLPVEYPEVEETSEEEEDEDMDGDEEGGEESDELDEEDEEDDE